MRLLDQNSGGRVPSVPPVDFHDILAAVQGEMVYK